MRQDHLHQERSPRIDVIHQIVAFHIGLFRRGQRNGAGIINQDVDPAKFVHRLLDGGPNGDLIADIHHASKRLTAGGFNYKGKKRSSSILRPCVVRIRCLLSAAAVKIVPRSFGCGSAVFAAITTLAPSRAAFSAIALPIPRDAPVMKSVLPASLLLFIGREANLRC